MKITIPTTASVAESFADGFVVAHATVLDLTSKEQLTIEEQEKLILVKTVLLIELGYSPSRESVNAAILRIYGQRVLDNILLSVKNAKETLSSMSPESPT